MKKIMSFVALCLVATPVFAVSPAGQGRRAAANQMGARSTASVNQLNAMSSMASMSVGGVTTDKPSIKVEPTTPAAPETPETPEKDMREKEKAACVNNNIGVGNTFVWASRYSNLNNYASMVEDVDEPANNTCFVKVEMKSDDSKISVADIPAKYFEMGNAITCGAWADEKVLEKRILDAKKSARTWGTVAGAVGGAAVGVGAMELFGNKLIGGSVQGQKALKDNDLLYSQLAVLKKNDLTRFNQIMDEVKNLKDECESDIWKNTDAKLPDACNQIDYNYLLGLRSI